MSTLANFQNVQTQESRATDWGLCRIDNWNLSFCLIPKQCFITNKWIWLKKCYKGTLVITGPGLPVVDNYYLDKSTFIFWNLKGKK